MIINNGQTQTTCITSLVYTHDFNSIYLVFSLLVNYQNLVRLARDVRWQCHVRLSLIISKLEHRWEAITSQKLWLRILRSFGFRLEALVLLRLGEMRVLASSPFWAADFLTAARLLLLHLSEAPIEFTFGSTSSSEQSPKLNSEQNRVSTVDILWKANFASDTLGAEVVSGSVFMLVWEEVWEIMQWNLAWLIYSCILWGMKTTDI